MNRFEYKVANGYEIQEFQKLIDIETAKKWLTSKKQRRFAKATRLEDGSIKLIGHKVVCPHCRASKPAYPRNLVEPYVRPHLPGRKPSRFVKKWFEDGTPGVMRFNQPTRPELLRTYRCHACGYASEAKTRDEVVEIESEDRRVTMRTTTPGVSSLALFPFSEKSFQVMLPLREAITFDFATGRVSMSVINGNGKVIGEADITNNLMVWKSSKCHSLLAKNTLVRRKILSLFRKVLDLEKLPIPALIINPLSLVEMCRFQGYPETFYETIPYDVECPGHLDESFLSRAEELRDAKTLPAIYERSGLPAKMKSIRRAVFEDLSLVWYFPEIKLLFFAIGEDPNMLRRFLGHTRICEVLGHIHDSPGLCDFFGEFAMNRGPKNLLRLIQKDPAKTMEYGRVFFSLSDYARVREQKKWAYREFFLEWQNGFSGFNGPGAANYSVPMGRGPLEDEYIPPSVVAGYKFQRLTNSAAYAIAADTLNNCLGSYTPNLSPVYTISRGDEILGAIEIFGSSTVSQARLKGNLSITADKTIYDSFGSWCRMNRLAFSHYFNAEDVFDEDDCEQNF